MVTYKQHYVKQEYLKKWTINNEFFVLNKKSNTIKKRGTKAICFNYSFYKLNRLTSDEKKFFNIIYKNVHSNLKKSIFEINEILDYEVDVEADDEKVKNIVKQIFNDNKTTIENSVFTQAGEMFAGDIESGISSDLWERIYKKDTSIINDEKTRINFYSYLIGQFWRVPAKKETMSKALNEINQKGNLSLSVDRMFPYFVLHQTMIESAYMSSYNEHRLIYLTIDNSTNIKFITSDNPVINMNTNANKKPEYYFPLTPEVALLVVKDYTIDDSILTKAEVSKFNKLIYDNATQYVIAQSNNDIASFYNP